MSRHRDVVAIIILGILSALVIVRFRFALYNTGSGAYRLDRLTGAIVSLGTLTASPETPPRLLHQWEVMTLPQTGNAKLSLETKWQDGALLYHFMIKAPLPQKIKDARLEPSARYTVILIDKDNFPMTQIHVLLLQMTPIVDAKGQTTDLEMYGNEALPMKSHAQSPIGR